MKKIITILIFAIISQKAFSDQIYFISGINEKTQPKSIIIFPNPSNGIFYLSKKVEKLKVLDSRGSILLSDENTDEINLSKSYKGIYYLIIMDEKNQITKKLIIN